MSLTEKQAYVESVSYRAFLAERVSLSTNTIPMFYPVPKLMFGPAAPRASVLEAFYLGCPGIQGMSWLGELAEKLIARITAGEQSSLYFPDGNASVARLLVHKLIPKATTVYLPVTTAQSRTGAHNYLRVKGAAGPGPGSGSIQGVV